MAEFIRSNRGNQQILFEGNIYTFHKLLAAGQARWRCTKYYSGYRCQASLQTPDPSQCQVCLIVTFDML
ncbi:MAG: hypothetical protein GY937_09925, partial [bacterium]|nr:hypothetical protein [bacterium]